MANRNPPFICETETIQKCSLSDAEFQIRSQFSELHSRLNELQQELLRELDQLIGDRTCKNSEVEANLRVLELALEGIETTFAGNILNSEYSETKHSILNKIHQLKQYRVPDIESILLIWDSEFERCLGKICAISQILPPQGEQRELIHRIAKSREPELGQIWFVVSARWFKEWRSEVNFDNSIFRNMFSSQTSPKRIPIDYSNITKGSTLKYGLKKNRHFILLHSDAWELLLGWHGMENGSVPIPRKTYFDNVNNRVQVDLWECSARESPERNRRSVPPAAPPAPPVPSKGAYYIEDSWRPPGWNCDIKVHVRERDNVSVHSAKCSVVSTAFSFN